MSGPGGTDAAPLPLSMPALLRASIRVYSREVHEALAAAGYGDLPRNGSYVISASARRSTPLSAIIERLGLSKQASGQLVDNLVARGYLERTVDPGDRRRLLITVTKRGRAAAGVIRKAVDRVDARLVARIGPERVAAAREVLAALAGE